MPATKRKQVKEVKAPYRAKRASSTEESAPEGVTVRWAEIENAAKPIVLERDGEPVAVVVKYDE